VVGWSTAPGRLTGDMQWPPSMRVGRRGVDAEIGSRRSNQAVEETYQAKLDEDNRTRI
jgi:hypothetical protein